MSQDILTIIIIFAIFAAIGIFGHVSKRNQKGIIKLRIEKEWGKFSEREYEEKEFESISHYFQNQLANGKIDGPYIDDITWNDLDMDSIFCVMNQSLSSAGDEYLYYTLRTPQFREEILEERERLIRFFSKDKEARIKLQMHFQEIGRTKKISISDYLNLLSDLKQESNKRHYFALLLYLVSILLMFFNVGIGILAFIISCGKNINDYYRRKSEVEPYVITFAYILRFLHASDQFEQLELAEVQSYIDRIAVNKKALQKFRKGSRILVSGKSMGASLQDAALDYVRMLFHIDLMKFNTMLREIKGHIKEIEAIVENLGTLETAIVIASFRESLPFYAIPELQNSRDAFVDIKNVYHPLILEPVANSLTEQKSVLITGSNASGKSTFLKTVAVNAILAQTIHTCAATVYRSNFFQIYSSMALKDNLQGNESYYIVEIKSLKRILNHMEDQIPILCFIDEVLRGTNTIERISASAQILKSLAKPHVLCFAATHDIELTNILEDQYSNYHFQEEILENDILFNYELQEGRATSRNAIKLLQIIGYDQEIIEKAEATAGRFLQTGEWTL